MYAPAAGLKKEGPSSIGQALSEWSGSMTGGVPRSKAAGYRSTRAAASTGHSYGGSSRAASPRFSLEGMLERFTHART